MTVRRDIFDVSSSPDPLKPLENQKALVTGANSGDRRSLRSRAAGADVVISYISRPEEAERVANIIQQGGRRAIAFQADVSQEDQVQAMFADVLKEFGTVDILVNNAALQRDSRSGHDPATMEYGDRDQPDRPISLRARSGARIPAARRRLYPGFATGG